MKKLLFFLPVAALLLFGCPTPERHLVGEYPLSQEEIDLVPYADGDTLILSSQAGQAIIFDIQRVSAWKEEAFPLCGYSRTIDYVRYQYDQTVLSSQYPQITISMNLYPRGYYMDSMTVIEISINSMYHGRLFYDTAFVAMDNDSLAGSLTISGRTFYNVVICPLYSNLSDTSAIYFTELLYNKQYGIIALKLSDNEAFVVNN